MIMMGLCKTNAKNQAQRETQLDFERIFSMGKKAQRAKGAEKQSMAEQAKAVALATRLNTLKINQWQLLSKYSVWA